MSADGKEVSDPKTATSSGNAQESNVIDDQVLPIHEAPDHGHQADESPRKLKKKLHESNKKIITLKKKLKVAQQKSRRLKTKVTSLQSVVSQLREKNMISTSCEEILKTTFSDMPLAVMKRISSGKSGKGCKYPPEIKSFALTLQFYSSKAYEFVRKTFDMALPHQTQIRKWYAKVPAAPGFTEPAFEALKIKVEEAKKDRKKVVCSLMLDEMAIKKHVSWDGKKYHGYVDIGNGIDDDSTPVAKDALVFMVVSVNSTWKVPCAYFFIDGLSGSERANLVKICIQRLWDIGVKVTSLTCDGPSCHFAMLRELGASLKLPANLVTSFPHPCAEQERIHVLLDVCHMLKLVRNTLAEGGILVDINNEKILWQYVVELHNLQQSEGLRLGNKLKLAHIKWRQQKMKVNLAAQALSSSVADAMEYCSSVLKLKQFQGCEATVTFIRMFDHLFDILNSRNPFAKGYKSALRISNKVTWEPFLNEAHKYIMGLKDASRKAMTTTRRKTGFIGFLVAIQSIRQIFHDLVEAPNAPLIYILAYKFSQDHLELFFGAVRSSGGFNNNPTAQQFTATYKRLLVRSSIEGTNGNCEKRDPIEILDVLSNTHTINGQDLSITNAAIIRKYDLEERCPVQSDHDYTDAPNITSISEFKQAAISFMAGYVAKMVAKQLLCDKCSSSLGSTATGTAPQSAFMVLKDRGGLFKPSPSVVKVCEETEKCFERLLAVTGGNLPRTKGIPDAIAVSVLGSTNHSKVFTELDNHMVDSPVDENHVFALIKSIAKSYSKIRFYHLGKETTANLSQFGGNSS